MLSGSAHSDHEEDVHSLKAQLAAQQQLLEEVLAGRRAVSAPHAEGALLLHPQRRFAPDWVQWSVGVMRSPVSARVAAAWFGPPLWGFLLCS